MTVKELKEKLSSYPDDTKVYCTCWAEDEHGKVVDDAEITDVYEFKGVIMMQRNS